MRYKFAQIAINSTAKKKPTEEDKTVYVGLEHIVPGDFFIKDYGSDVTPKGDKLLMKKGDVLFGKRRAYQRKVAIAPCDGIFSAHGMVLRPMESVVDKDFFPFFISSDQFMNEAIRISVGGLSPTINWKDLKECEFSLPPLSEQRVLADKLWAAYRLKEAYKKLIDATKDMVKAKFVEMFEAKYPMVKVGDIIKTTSGGTPSKNHAEYYEQGTIPWLTSGEVSQGEINATKNFITEEGLENSSAKWVPKGCVVIAMYGATVGKSGIINIPLTTNQAICTLLPTDKFNNKYLLYAVRNKEKWMVESARGAAQPNISQETIKNMELPLPPMDKQMDYSMIVDQSSRSLSSLRRAITSVNNVMKSLINN